jgi:hypothetical protein
MGAGNVDQLGRYLVGDPAGRAAAMVADGRGG